MEDTTRIKNVRLLVTAGSVWVTRTGCRDDLCLVAGQSADLAGAGWVVGPTGPGNPCSFEVSALEKPWRRAGRDRGVAAWA
jgi:hypothetical protein